MNIITVGIGTTIIILFSWFLSIKHKRYHGIARFFAFESIFIMVTLNIRIWFHNPFSVNQIISWILLIFSLYPAIAGYVLLKRIGKPTANFENTSILVKTGLYKYIRHPLYLSVFLFGTGVMMKDPGILQLLLGTVNLIAICITARMEEKEMIARFGEEYCNYMKETKMFIPYLF
jgi:protein-S-isoprenylcysteine O-methyltransferase Ste14